VAHDSDGHRQNLAGVRRSKPAAATRFTDNEHPSMAFTPPGRRRAAHRALITACAAAMLVGALPAPAQAQAQNQLPALGDAVSEDFDVSIERRLGDQIMRSVRRDPDYLDDPMLLDYVQSLWQPLVAVARSRGEIAEDITQRFAWEPFLVRDRSVNAFALPGGFIGVYLGLIAVTGSSDELASVLAHELSHVTQRHIARGLVNSRRQSLLSAAAMILGVLAASRARSGDAANAVIVGGQGASIQGQHNFSRDLEREADRIGYTLLTGAGFAPGGMAAMFEKLDQASRLNDSGGYPYLRSHPLTTERIGEARSRLGSNPRPPAAAQFEHTLAQARARVLMDTRVQSLQRWQALDEGAPRQLPEGADVSEALAAAASAALASTLLRDWARADASLARADVLLRAGLRSADLAAASRARARQMLVMLAAQSQLERGDPAAAATTLATAPDTGGTGGRALLLLGLPGTAKTWVSEHLAAAISGNSTLLVQGTAGPAEEALGQVQVVRVGLPNLAFTRGTLLVIFGARPLDALHLAISLLQAALVVGGLAPVAQALLLAVGGAGGDDFPHGIEQYVRVRGEVHMGLDNEGVDAHGERLVGTFPHQGVPGIDHDLVDPVKQLRGEQADIVFDRL
jgi:predicted Zn-dependent protease